MKINFIVFLHKYRICASHYNNATHYIFLCHSPILLSYSNSRFFSHLSARDFHQHLQAMAVEICVKAAAGAPDILGDCNFSDFVCNLHFAPNTHTHAHKPALLGSFNGSFFSDENCFWHFRPLLPESYADIGREESWVQAAFNQRRRQAPVVICSKRCWI